MIIASHQLIGHPDRAARITSVLLSALLLQTIAPLEAQAENPEVTRWEERINATRKAIRNTTNAVEKADLAERLSLQEQELLSLRRGIVLEEREAALAVAQAHKSFVCAGGGAGRN